MIGENEDLLQRGFKINHLISLLELHTKKDIQNRDRWWVLRFRNLVDTLENVSGRRVSYLQEEINNTEQRLKLI